MSDLLPLVAAALRDKVALDASEEISTLRKERDALARVEVIRMRDNGEGEEEDDDVVVYASAPFEDGRYGNNTNLWQVNLQSGGAEDCLLADLRDCKVCVGGGFPFANLDDQDNAPYFEGWLHDPAEDEYEGRPVEDAVGVRFCFSPYSTWLTIWVRGWPRAEWEAKIMEDDLDPDEVVGFLVEDVASQYPDATVEFKEVSFVTKHIHGALKRLLSPRRAEEVRADRDARRNEAADPERAELMEFVMYT